MLRVCRCTNHILPSWSNMTVQQSVMCHIRLKECCAEQLSSLKKEHLRVLDHLRATHALEHSSSKVAELTNKLNSKEVRLYRPFSFFQRNSVLPNLTCSYRLQWNICKSSWKNCRDVKRPSEYPKVKKTLCRNRWAGFMCILFSCSFLTLNKQHIHIKTFKCYNIHI